MTRTLRAANAALAVIDGELAEPEFGLFWWDQIDPAMAALDAIKGDLCSQLQDAWDWDCAPVVDYDRELSRQWAEFVSAYTCAPEVREWLLALEL